MRERLKNLNKYHKNNYIPPCIKQYDQFPYRAKVLLFHFEQIDCLCHVLNQLDYVSGTNRRTQVVEHPVILSDIVPHILVYWQLMGAKNKMYTHNKF
jgi:hypothetical protein